MHTLRHQPGLQVAQFERFMVSRVVEETLCDQCLQKTQ